jgi:hypothetical protein
MLRARDSTLGAVSHTELAAHAMVVAALILLAMIVAGVF